MFISEYDTNEDKPLCAALWNETIQQSCAGSRGLMFGADFDVNVPFVIFMIFIFFFKLARCKFSLMKFPEGFMH